MPPAAVWETYDRERLDREYDASKTVPSTEPYIRSYVERSAAARARYELRTDLAYGKHPREILDLFPAAVTGAPLVLFVHGGYWRRFSKDEFTFTVEPFVRRGAAAAVISYPLAPEASLDDIVASVRAAVGWLHRHPELTRAARGRIVAVGHSAGGHLVGMLAGTDWDRHGIAPDSAVPGDSPLRAIVPISGLFELEPVRRSHVNEWLRIDEEGARRNGPLCFPNAAVRLVAGVGSLETSEFRRQTHAYVECWNAAGARAHAIECAGRNHFDVLDDLARDDGPLALAVLDLL